MSISGTNSQIRLRNRTFDFGKFKFVGIMQNHNLFLFTCQSRAGLARNPEFSINRSLQVRKMDKCSWCDLSEEDKMFQV